MKKERKRRGDVNRMVAPPQGVRMGSLVEDPPTWHSPPTSWGGGPGAPPITYRFELGVDLRCYRASRQGQTG